MSTIDDFHSTKDDYVSVDSEQDSITSKQLIEAFGPGMGCFRIDDIVNGKTISTGNVVLTWSPMLAQYTSASPNPVNMNF